MPSDTPLPLPYSDELLEGLRHRGHTSSVHQHIYSVLYERRDNPPTDVEITDAVSALMDKKYSQLQRRRRDVGEVFQLTKVDGHHYRLDGWREVELAKSTPINKRVRYQVLQTGKCAKCGRTVADDDVKLDVDHVIPQNWGGSDELDNLQALCQDCNAGKKNYYATFDGYADDIKAAANYDQPHRRIAMLLLAANGDWLPSELIGAIASAKQYQEDWQKRMRELRYLNWTIESRRERGVHGRVNTFYRASHTEPLPSGDLANMVRRIEKERAEAKKAKASADSTE